METYKFTCAWCNFKCQYNSGWLDHISSKKHLRQGKPVIYKCDIPDCVYESPTHWNLKVHKMNNHSTKEEKAMSKYYCNECSQVFFTNVYKDRHLVGKRHINQVKINALKIQSTT